MRLYFAVSACLIVSAAAWAATTDLVVNPGFEDGAKGWTFAVAEAGPGRVLVTADVPHSGGHALLMDATHAPWEVGALSDPMPVTAGTRYRFGVWVKEVGGYGAYKAVIDWRDAQDKHISYSNDWRGHNRPIDYAPHGGDFQAPPGATHALLNIGVETGSAVLMDDFSLVAMPPEGPRLRAYLFSEPPDAEGKWLVRAWMCNEGDAPTRAATLALVFPPGLHADNLVRPLPALVPTERLRLEWTLTGKPRSLPASLSLRMPQGTPVVGDTSTTLFVGVGEMKETTGSGVPAPDPAEARPLVGAYYFPVMLDWDRSGWGVRHVDYLTPLLGYYDEALPEVADWHILWAVEHGLSFFAYDWYYNDGCLYINDALEKGFLKARHRSAMKFFINWCNEGQCTWDKPLNFSTESLCGFMEYLCTHYLALPEYLRVKGRPVVMIIRPDPILQWHGGPDGSRKALEAMKQVARRHGLPDPYFMCVCSAEAAPLYRRAGYDGLTAYTYGFGEAPRRPDGNWDYDDLVTEHEKAWQSSLANAKAGGMDYMPAAWTGWDDNARAYGKSVRTVGNTAGRFREMCRLVRKYADPSLNMVIVEAWNEWGEGGYLEASKERGLSFLDAIRDAFTGLHGPHVDLYPTPAQRASYNTDITCEQVDEMYIRRDRERRGLGDMTRPEWNFDVPGDFRGWYHMANVDEVSVGAEGLSGVSMSNDPALSGPTLMNVHAADWSALRVRMKVDAGVMAQVFWCTADAPVTSEEASAQVSLRADGAWHDYVFPVAENPHWQGVIRQLRFDPTNAAGAHFTIASIVGVPSQR